MRKQRNNEKVFENVQHNELTTIDDIEDGII